MPVFNFTQMIQALMVVGVEALTEQMTTPPEPKILVEMPDADPPQTETVHASLYKKDMAQVIKSGLPAGSMVSTADKFIPEHAEANHQVIASTSATQKRLKERLAKELYRMQMDLEDGAHIGGIPCDCMPGTSLIYQASDTDGQTTRAVAPISEVYKHKRKFVISHTAKTQRITSHLTRVFSGEMFNIGIGYSNIPLEVTPEHPILSIKKGWKWNWRNHYGGLDDREAAWIGAKDLGTDDFVLFPRLQNTRDMEIITPDLAEILGWYVAEGCKGNENRVVFSLGHHEAGYIANLKQMISRTFGEEPQEYPRPTSLHLAYSHREFVPLFSMFGHRATRKHLPSWVFHLPEHKIGRFLRGVLQGDGSISDGCIAYSTQSAELAFQLRLLLFKLGILHSLGQSTMQDGNIDGRTIRSNGPTYFIHISGEAADRVLELTHIPSQLQRRRAARNQGWVTEGNVFLPVKRIKHAPFQGKVYNLSVSGDESYLTPNGAVHNCLDGKHKLGLQATAEELIAMDTSPVPQKVLGWLSTHEPELNPAAIAKYGPDHYRKLATDMREFRKDLGT